MAIEIKNLCKKHNDKVILDNISLDIKDGEFVCIIGPSGCGKSTFLDMVSGLFPYDGGEILVDGHKITGPGADRVLMLQEAALYPWLSVIENVKFGMQVSGVDKKTQEERARHYLKMVELYDFKDYRVNQLSGGMKQRVSLARALALESKVLLMDEPFSALDKQTKNILCDEIQNIWMQTHRTIILVTHSVEEALFFGDKVVLFDANPGRIKKIFYVDFDRPRRISDADFIEYRADILSQIREEVERIAKDEYDH